MPHCRQCKSHFPNRVLIDNKTRNLSKRQYCLKCSPFKQHNTRIIENYGNNTKRCTICEQMLPVSSFSPKRSGHHSHCKQCTNLRVQQKQKHIKQQCVNHLGGKCSICGYSKCLAALEFHHTNPSIKDFSISSCASTKFVKLQEELDKCILLCSNCHKEQHYK